MADKRDRQAMGLLQTLRAALQAQRKVRCRRVSRVAAVH